MPKIELDRKEFYKKLLKKYTIDELEEHLTSIKAEIDEYDDLKIKIELNDTNRPDLWTREGIVRHLNLFFENKTYKYNFSDKNFENRRIIVNSNIKKIRPFIIAFVASGITLNDDILKNLIHSQEKISENYGRKRQDVSAGIYREDFIKYPVKYTGETEDFEFIPLGFDKKMSIKKILKNHPKGIQYFSILKSSEVYPVLKDKNDSVLSLAPITNSSETGEVKIGDSNLFVEFTGNDLNKVLLSSLIIACDMQDMGFTIKPVEIKYDYKTNYGDKIIAPYYFQKETILKIKDLTKISGEKFKEEEIVNLLKKFNSEVKIENKEIILKPAPYRNDFLHGVDIAEDLIIAYGLKRFNRTIPSDFTEGKLLDIEVFSRKIKNIMIGLRYLEMIFNYMGSNKDFVYKMNKNYLEILKNDEKELVKLLKNTNCIQIENPMSENYESIRNSILPSLLSSESISKKAMYPHYIFEIGKVIVKDEKNLHGFSTINSLGFLIGELEGDFSKISSHVKIILTELNLKFSLKESTDSRFIKSRVAKIVVNEVEVGIYGELLPEILDNFEVSNPCSFAEINLDLLLNNMRNKI